MCDTAPESEAIQATVWGDDTVWSVTWWYPDGQTITRIGDVTVIDPGDDGVHIQRDNHGTVTAI
jgi:hypothetical protein